MKTKKVLGIIILVLIGLGLLPATREELRWRLVVSADKAQGYAQYLNAWPNGRYAVEAKSHYDERSWSDVQSTRTLQAYRNYEQTNPNGSHLSEARTRIEDLTWQQATNANTIRVIQAYAEAYPKGRFIVEAQEKQASLRTDERPFSDAFQKGTESAFRQFLSDFPGHVKESEAQQDLNDITEGRDIVGLLTEKKIEIQTQGSGIRSVSVRVRKLVPYPLTVHIPVGSYFVSASQSSQNMVTTAERSVRLTTDDWQSVDPSAACANRPRAIPSSRDTFTVQRSPHQTELAALMPILDKSGVDFSTRQAAVWLVTDDATYSDLGILVARFEHGDSRAIHENETAHAMMVCDQAGIDVIHKRIWRDRIEILRGLTDNRLKNWLQEKSGSLIAALDDEDFIVRLSAVEELGSRKDTKAVEPLISALKDSNSHVRQAAANALGNIEDPRAVEPLIAVLGDSDYLMRETTARALGAIHDPRAFQPLINMLENDQQTRAVAALALGLLQDKRAVEPLIQALKIENFSIRRNSAYALGELGDLRAVGPLIEIIDYSVNDVPEMVAVALSKITGDTNGLPGYLLLGKKEIISPFDAKSRAASIQYWKAYGRRINR